MHVLWMRAADTKAAAIGARAAAVIAAVARADHRGRAPRRVPKRPASTAGQGSAGVPVVDGDEARPGAGNARSAGGSMDAEVVARGVNRRGRPSCGSATWAP